jgi:hypothetical protein
MVYQFFLWVGMMAAFAAADGPALTLVNNGTSAYTIVIPDDPLPADKEAATVLQRYIARISGATLPVHSERDATKGAAIYLGRTAAAENLYDFKRLRYDGYFIATAGSALYIAGAHGKGTVYGVYEFLDKYLGCKKFSSAPAYVPKTSTLLVAEGIYDLQLPAFAFRQSYYPPSADPEYLEWHRLHQFEDLWGVWGHSYFKFVPPGDYFAAHPEYFAEVKGQRKPTQLCLSNEAVFRLTVAYLRAKMAKTPDALYWSVSPNDGGGYCTCPLCRKTDAEEGGPQGSLIRFVNRVAAQFPDKVITTLAYGYTSKAPGLTRPAPNVYIMLSSIDVLRQQPLSEVLSGAAFRANLEAWAALTAHLFLWDYTTQFTSYLSPFPDYAQLQPNLQYVRRHSIQGVFEQGSGDTYGDMAEYNSYLQAALLWDPYADVSGLTAEFCNGYYGPGAGPYISQYLNVLTHTLVESGKPLDIYGNPINEHNSFLAPEAVAQYEALMDKAAAAASPAAGIGAMSVTGIGGGSPTASPLYAARVQTARLSLDYAVLQQSRFYGLDPGGYLVSDGHGGYQVRPDWPDRVQRFVATCKRSGVTELSEGGLSPAAYAAEWQGIFAKGWEPNKALHAQVTLVYPYADDYPAKGPQTLTDGVPGYTDFSYNWLCFYGVDMVATLDLGASQSLQEVHMHFLSDPRHWIFLPSLVDVDISEDGTNYTPLGSYTYPAPQETTVPGIDDRRFPSTGAIRARYIRVSARVPGALPVWRPSDTKKPMICCDEVYVR